MTKTLEELQGDFDKIYPCIQEGCDNNGTYPTLSNGNCEPNPCRYCHENRLPIKELIEKAFNLGQLSGVELAKGRLPGEITTMIGIGLDEDEKGFNQCRAKSITNLTALQGELGK